jgi:hypothetical protein
MSSIKLRRGRARPVAASAVAMLAVVSLMSCRPDDASADCLVAPALGQDLPPTLAPISNEFVVADSVISVPLLVGDDGPLGALVLTATSDNQALVPNSAFAFSGTDAERTLAVTLTRDTYGAARVTVAVSDGNQTAQRCFIIVVQARQTFTYSFPEGSTGSFFSTDIAIANPHAAIATFDVTFIKDDGTSVVRSVTMPPTSRTTIRVKDVPGMEAAAFSTQIVSPVPLFAERSMFWDGSGYGASLEQSAGTADKIWYFAEGSQGFFQTYFLLMNPSPYATRAYFTFLREKAPPVFRDYPMAANSRLTLDAGAVPELANSSFGSSIYFDVPGLAERAMYFGTAPLFTGGSVTLGAQATNSRGDLVEGSTGPFFDTFILLANPNLEAATATLTYRPLGGAAVTRTHRIPPQQRLTINIATEDPSLENAAVSTHIDSDRTLVVERAQYWPRGNWQESHISHAVRDPWDKWVLAEGRAGGANHAQTYVLIQNPHATAAEITARFLRTDGTTLVKRFTVSPTSRFNIGITGGPGSDVPELANESFSTVVESTLPVSVEHSLYFDANGVTWAAGANARAVPYPRTTVTGSCP